MACPPGAADWFSKAHQRLTNIDLGPHYAAVVAVWTRMEQASCFETGDDKLPAKNRPTSVAKWLKSNKPQAPNIANVGTFVTAWQRYWDGMQPEWRTRGNDRSWKVDSVYGGKGAEWGALYTWGPHGIVSVVACGAAWFKTT
ncbi:hypothetical protein B0H10DRAFT_2375321 [Mycena sp. CBHHK59/15]|nr:hypothetical protein B0H10DRAFT_2375321 [Mycena sp. CBHHK59/15]